MKFCRAFIFASVALQILSMPTAYAKVTYYHNNFLGSPVAATNEQGALIWRARYRPYGNRDQTNSSYMSSLGNPLWYAGHAHEDSIGLTYMLARYYSGALGRFMSVDPKPFSATNPQSFNRFSYANNNPYRYLDPDGRDSVLFTVKGAASAGVGANAGIGVYVSFPWLDSTPWDAGLITTAGLTAGANLSATANVTLAPGGRENIEGKAVVTNATLPLTGALGLAVDAEHSINTTTGESAGTSLGIGLSALPGASVSVNYTAVNFSVREFMQGLMVDQTVETTSPEDLSEEDLALSLWFGAIAN